MRMTMKPRQIAFILFFLLTSCHKSTQITHIDSSVANTTVRLHHHMWQINHTSTKSMDRKYGLAPDPGSIVPSSWTVPAWYIDPSNSTGCASDSNNGRSATCGVYPQYSVGPLASWRGLNVVKWGCLGNPSACPRLLQNTTITFLSSQITNDPIIFTPSIENGTSTILQCGLGPSQIIASGTLGTVTPKNRSANQALVSTFNIGDAGSSLQPGTFIINTTHASRAWTIRDTGGGAWLISQPAGQLIPPLTPLYYPPLNEVDTWSNGDSVTVYSESSIQLSQIVPVGVVIDPAYDSAVYVVNCNVVAANNSNFEASFFSNFVFILESNIYNGNFMNFDGMPSGAINSYSTTGWGIGMASAFLYAGGTPGFIGTGTGAMIDFDFVFAKTGDFNISSNQEPNIGCAYIDEGVNLDAYPPGGIWIRTVQSCGSVYGPGGIEVNPGSLLRVDSTAYSGLLLSGGITLNGQSKACSAPGEESTSTDGGVSTPIWCGIPITEPNLDTTAGPHSFGGYAFLPGPGGSAILNELPH